MPTTINLPQQTYQPGDHTFGPAALPAGYSDAVFTISRTVGAKPLNGESASTSVDLLIQVSYDGGNTWHDTAIAGAVGGVYHDEAGVTFTQVLVDCPLYQPDSATRQARAVLTVGGAAVSLSGTLVLS